MNRPSWFESVWAMTLFSFRRTIRGRNAALACVGPLLVLVIATTARYALGSDPETTFDLVVRLGFMGLLVYLVPFLLTASVISEEVDRRTFTYLAVRPFGRVAFALGRTLAAVVLCAAILSASVLLLEVALFVNDPSAMGAHLPAALRYSGTLALLSFAYCGVCLFWGALVTSGSGFASAIYLGIVEFLFGMLPKLNRLSMHAWALSIAGFPNGTEEDSVFETSLAPFVLLFGAALFIVLGSSLVRMREFGEGKP